MPVKFYCGYTKSGKSTLAEKVVSKYKKVIIFDKQHCFKGDVYEDPRAEGFKKIFTKYCTKGEFRIVIRPGRLSDREALCDDTIKLASALGRLMGRGAAEEDCVQLVIDEADSVCNPSYQSPKLKFIVNEGRHDNVDSHFIARSPNRVHTDIRANASEIYCFRLANALRIEFLVDTFDRENAQRILTLRKYWYFKADETGFRGLYDENSKLVKDFSGETEDFFKTDKPKKVRVKK